MNLEKLSKYFSGKLPNSEKTNVSEFINVLGDLGIKDANIEGFRTKFGALKTDYDKIFEIILKSESGKQKIEAILDAYDLPHSIISYHSFDSSHSIGNDVQEKTLIDIALIEKFLNNASEEEFAKYLIVPLFAEMGFKSLAFYGKVHEKDYGLDMYPIVFETPFGDHQHIGIQFKKCNLSNGSTNAEWQNLRSEITDAFDHNGEHRSPSGSKIKIDGLITVTSGRKSALDLDSDLAQAYRSSYVRAYDRENVIGWCTRFALPKNLLPIIESIANKPMPAKAKEAKEA